MRALYANFSTSKTTLAPMVRKSVYQLMHYYGVVNASEAKLKANNTWANFILTAKQNGRVLDSSVEVLKAAIEGVLDLIDNQDFVDIWEECESEQIAKSGKKSSDIGAREKREVVANMIEWEWEQNIYEQAGVS